MEKTSQKNRMTLSTQRPYSKAEKKCWVSMVLVVSKDGLELAVDLDRLLLPL